MCGCVGPPMVGVYEGTKFHPLLVDNEILVGAKAHLKSAKHSLGG